MKFNFRQGIQHSPMTSGSPSFLTYNTGNDTITMAVGIDLVRATAAWRDVNYLIEERENATDVWGPFNNLSAYLYWDINLASGELTHGFTSIEPGFDATEPLNPSNDQHWFDTSINVMKVWNGVQWNQKIRVFAALFNGGSKVISEFQFGTQVGIIGGSTQATWFDHGYILYGIDQKAIKNSDGSIVTTAVPLNTYHGSFSSPIRLELSNSLALAAQPIPAFSAVMAVGDGTIKLASGTNPEKRPVGISPIPVMTGDPVDIVFKGIVYNDQWNWDYALGKDLYCGSTGILFQGNGSITSSTRVGAILDPKTVLIDIDLFGSGGGGGGGPSHPANMIAEENSELTINDLGTPSEANLTLKLNDVVVMVTDSDSTVYSNDHRLESGIINTQHLELDDEVGAIGQTVKSNGAGTTVWGGDPYQGAATPPIYMVDTFTGNNGALITDHVTDSFDFWTVSYNDTPIIQNNRLVPANGSNNDNYIISTTNTTIPDTYQLTIVMQFTNVGDGDEIYIYGNIPTAEDYSYGYGLYFYVNQSYDSLPVRNQLWLGIYPNDGSLVFELDDDILFEQPGVLDDGLHTFRIDVSPTLWKMSFDNIECWKGMSTSNLDKKKGVVTAEVYLYSQESGVPTIQLESFNIIPVTMPEPLTCKYFNNIVPGPDYPYVSINGIYSNEDATSVVFSTGSGSYGSTELAVYRWIQGGANNTDGTYTRLTSSAYSLGSVIDATESLDVVIGNVWVPGNGNHGFISQWNNGNPIFIELPQQSGFGYCTAKAISADGTVVVGYGDYSESFVWTSGTGLVWLGPLQPNSSTYTYNAAAGISGDGTTIFGGSSFNFNNSAQVVWYYKRASPGFVIIPFPIGAIYARATHISYDGDLIAGGASNNSTYSYGWTYRISTSSFTIIPLPPGTITTTSTNVSITGMSDDGTIIVGNIGNIPADAQGGPYEKGFIYRVNISSSFINFRIYGHNIQQITGISRDGSRYWGYEYYPEYNSSNDPAFSSFVGFWGVTSSGYCQSFGVIDNTTAFIPTYVTNPDTFTAIGRDVRPNLIRWHYICTVGA